MPWWPAGEAGALLPVISTMLHFSPQELERCRVSLAHFEGQSVAGKPSDAAADASYASSWGAWAFGGSGQ